MTKKIWLAGGCFWGVEEFFARVKGVLATNVGYANGPHGDVSYDEVCAASGHAEAVEITYDPATIAIRDLVDLLFLVIDPHALNRQGNDRGVQYRTGVYCDNATDLEAVRAEMRRRQAMTARKIVVEVLPLANYVPAEQYHQKYLRKNPGGYCHIDMDDLPEDYAKKEV